MRQRGISDCELAFWLMACVFFGSGLGLVVIRALRRILFEQ